MKRPWLGLKADWAVLVEGEGKVFAFPKREEDSFELAILAKGDDVARVLFANGDWFEVFEDDAKEKGEDVVVGVLFANADWFGSFPKAEKGEGVEFESFCVVNPKGDGVGRVLFAKGDWFEVFDVDPKEKEEEEDELESFPKAEPKDEGWFVDVVVLVSSKDFGASFSSVSGVVEVLEVSVSVVFVGVSVSAFVSVPISVPISVSVSVSVFISVFVSVPVSVPILVPVSVSVVTVGEVSSFVSLISSSFISVSVSVVIVGVSVWVFVSVSVSVGVVEMVSSFVSSLISSSGIFSTSISWGLVVIDGKSTGEIGLGGSVFGCGIELFMFLISYIQISPSLFKINKWGEVFWAWLKKRIRKEKEKKRRRKREITILR